MSHFKELLTKRRSHRCFTDEEISADDVQLILQAALMSPTSMNRRSWEFVVIDNKADLEKLSDAKEQGAAFIKDAPLAIAVLGKPLENDCWIEDCALAAFSMQMQAEDLGLGSCWVQMRGRGLNDGTMADTVIRGILDIPEDIRCLCLVAFGHVSEQREPSSSKQLHLHSEDDLKWEQVHIDKY